MNNIRKNAKLRKFPPMFIMLCCIQADLIEFILLPIAWIVNYIIRFFLIFDVITNYSIMKPALPAVSQTPTIGMSGHRRFI